MEHPKDNDSMPKSIDDADMISPRANDEFELADMTTKKKMLDDGPDNLAEVDNELDHSFDEDDALASPDRKAELTQINTNVQISWHDINISAEPQPGKCGKKAVGETKVILDGVSGCALPGQFISIIGASGAGKTTLLNHLSGRLIANNLTKSGTIKINNVESSKVSGFSTFSAYVQQDDILFETMTVRECLEFSAKLKLPGTLEEKLGKASEIIEDLKLTKCQNTNIGGYLIKGVSGGERKRTSIGVELITNPSLIFLDEPTTGLDSHTATQVMKLLAKLAASGRTIIQTIHQPNSDIFSMFDRLMLLAKGKTLYFNEAGLSVEYFAKIGFQIPELSNPADYFMSIMSIESIQKADVDPNDKDAVEKANLDVYKTYSDRIKLFDDSYNASELKNNPDEQFQGIEPISDKDVYNKQQTSWCYQFVLLMWRSFINQARLPQQSYIKVGATLFVSMMCLVIYWDLGSDKAGVQNRQGALFFLCINNGFSGVNNVNLIFPMERPVFLREVNNNMYTVSAYFWSKIFSELPMSCLMPTLQAVVVYFALGFNLELWYKFPIFLLTSVLCYNAFTGFGYILGTSISNPQVSVILTPVLIVPTMLFAGFFVNQENIPTFLLPIREIAVFKYAFQAYMINEFTDNQMDCMTDPNPVMSCDPLGDFNSPQTLEYSLLAMVVIWVVFYLVSFMIMMRMAKKYE